MKRKTKKFFCARHALLALLFACAVILYLAAVSVLWRAAPHLRLLIYPIKLTVALLLVSSQVSSESKCSWVFFVLAFPIIAIPAYLIFFDRRLTKKERYIITLLSKKKPKLLPAEMQSVTLSADLLSGLSGDKLVFSLED